jgi:hypothetical protein
MDFLPENTGMRETMASMANQWQHSALLDIPVPRYYVNITCEYALQKSRGVALFHMTVTVEETTRHERYQSDKSDKRHEAAMAEPTREEIRWL